MLELIYRTMDFFSLPHYIPLTALVATILAIFVILIAGTITKVISKAIVNFVSLVVGHRTAFVICSYLTYLGVIHHEFSHALIAFFTGAKIRKIRLKPKGKQLGCVEFIPRGNWFLKGLQSSFSAIAPIFCGSCTLYFLYTFAYPLCTTTWQIYLFFYVFICILLHMTLSEQDIKAFFSGFFQTFLSIYVISFIYVFFVTAWHF